MKQFSNQLGTMWDKTLFGNCT